jgi:hypothetical protein
MTPTDSEAAARQAARLCRIERQLDEALAATFPASDPVSMGMSQMEDGDDLGERVDLPLLPEHRSAS